MNVTKLDKLIGYFSPKAYHERVAYRAAAESLAYAAAKTGRGDAGWLTPSTGPNVEVASSLETLRNRSRALQRDNSYAVKAIDELVLHTVGTGVMPQADTGNEELNKVVDENWRWFADQCDPTRRLDFYGMQSQAMRAVAGDGESLARFRQRRATDPVHVKLQLQLLESDYIDTAKDGPTDNGSGYVRCGVQFNKLDALEGYWLFGQHPGESLQYGTLAAGYTSKFYPAYDVAHVFRLVGSRTGQMRGVPWLTPAIKMFYALDAYLESEMMRKRAESCLVGVVTNSGGSNTTPAFANRAIDEKTGNVLEQLRPMMVGYLKTGQSITFNEPKAIGGLNDFVMMILQRIAVALDLPYELLSGDLRNVNYSSYRAGMISFRAAVEVFAWQTLIPMFCMPVWRRFIDTLILQGIVPLDTPYGVSWTTPALPSVDPVKDAMANKQNIRNGTLNLPDAIANQGYDPRKYIEQRATWDKILDEYGIVLDSDPRRDKPAIAVAGPAAAGSSLARIAAKLLSRDRGELTRSYRS